MLDQSPEKFTDSQGNQCDMEETFLGAIALERND